MGLLEVFEGITSNQVNGNLFDIDLNPSIPETLVRKDDFLTHPIFHKYRSETEFMRYLRNMRANDTICGLMRKLYYK